MEVVNIGEGRYELSDDVASSSADSDASSGAPSDDSRDREPDAGLRADLQNTIPECYQCDSALSSRASDLTDDDDFHATALCQFMDILNDLDEVLDKSLLACLDDGTKSFDSDEEDLIFKIKSCIGESHDGSERSEAQSSMDDNTQVVTCSNVRPAAPPVEEIDITQNISERSNLTSLGRSKSFSELTDSDRQVFSSERASTTNENLRNSMRRLDPIVLPAITAESFCEPLTLPVILFLEHNINVRPTSAPIQLQVRAANLSGDGASGPLIVGRRALLMNRTLSLPAPGDAGAARWPASTSASSSSSESLHDAPAAPAADDDRVEETEEARGGAWPHRLSAVLACLGCTVGIFNISRFAIFSVHFGASFIVQFLILSLLIGIPLFTLHLCLGRVLSSGPVDMWRISPIFQGVGVALLVAQAVIGAYSVLGVSWLLVYFRDSFVTAHDRYKWALPHDYNLDDAVARNETYKIQETLPQYFHGEILQRNLGSNSSYFGTIKFQVAFNLAVVWMIVFVALSKGLRSYGKAVYALTLVAAGGTLVLCAKLLTLIPYDSVVQIFADTEWSEFFINSNSWAAAAQETFLTWGLLGACVMQLTSHARGGGGRKAGAALRCESACVVATTLGALLLAAVLANACVLVLRRHGYVYVPASYETVKSSQCLWPVSEPLPGGAAAPALRHRAHYAGLLGVTVWHAGGPGRHTGGPARSLSGWQPLQLATQLVPAALAVLPPNTVSPAWAVIFYLILIMFGIAQQLAIWHCVITGLMAINADALRAWETTITFLSCALGLAAGLLLATDGGIRIVHFMDYVWVGSWWQCVVQVVLACGVFVVRGRPYSPDVVVGALYSSRSRLSATLAALLSFTWTVVLPVLLCAICVMDFRVGQQRQLYSWRKPVGYWPVWCRQVAVLLQQGTLLLVPGAAFVQTWRYMNKGPPDILDRIQNLYRPHMGPSAEAPHAAAAAVRPPAPPPDPPPKYTPPPSYSTATGARLLNTIRRSFRTLRRITSARSEVPGGDDMMQLPVSLSVSECVAARDAHSLPPASLSVADETGGAGAAPASLSVADETGGAGAAPASLSVADETRGAGGAGAARASLSLTRDYLRRSFVRRSESAKSIRSSLRRSFRYGGALSTSHEQLVRGAEPPDCTPPAPPAH